MASKYTYSVGKRKTASAQVKIFEGTGKTTINGKNISEYINRSDLFEKVYEPLKLCKVKDKIYFDVNVSGSGESAQAEAIRHGLSIALVSYDVSFRKILKAAGLLTRDARKVERKKPGKHKARKGMQWSKR
ncbi:30S ribosomal protein S9 [Candidatus Gracilibacteria bacterium]|nr:MAG: 30S ribosomal protein S9 [Candidatus Gracilibacteria bacterium]PIE85057.1 MAG: 30S ribosomal protein S9 [Candidatus Gracilibacteria bacterium]